MVLVLVLLPPLASMHTGEAQVQASGGTSLWAALAITFGKVAAFVALMLVAGRRLLPRLLWFVARTGSRELFTLCVVAAGAADGVAWAWTDGRVTAWMTASAPMAAAMARVRFIGLLTT